MKLADDAKQMGVRYETAWRWFRDGKIQSRRIGPQTIILPDGQEKTQLTAPQPVAIYARVSSAGHISTLEHQAERLVAYGTARHCTRLPGGEGGRSDGVGRH